MDSFGSAKMSLFSKPIWRSRTDSSFSLAPKSHKSYFFFLAMDDETLAVALGYTCHVVSMIARFLQLPLRYSVNSRGSRSTIVDLTSEKVPEKDRK